jgi:hypothetical protein
MSLLFSVNTFFSCSQHVLPSLNTSFFFLNTSLLFQHILFYTPVECSRLRPKQQPVKYENQEQTSFVYTTTTTIKSISNLPLQQPPKEIKTIAITLQLPLPSCTPILPTQFLCNQQSPIRRYPLDPRFCASFLL